MDANNKAFSFTPEEMQKLKEKWGEEQDKLKRMLIEEDCFSWGFGEEQALPTLLGGVDVSFVKENDVDACVSLLILSFPELKVVYEHCSMVQLTHPYVSGFLAFREAPFIVKEYQTLIESRPELVPQAILCDGNGILHPRELRGAGFGLASHLGVLLGVPTIGVAKSFLFIDGMKKDFVKNVQMSLKKSGDSIPLKGLSGKTWGMALKSTALTTKPIFVSVGHAISLATATALVHACCLQRIPEPVRQADIRSREFIRKLLQ